jgi:DNA recombination protein RmuC
MSESNRRDDDSSTSVHLPTAVGGILLGGGVVAAIFVLKGRMKGRMQMSEIQSSLRRLEEGDTKILEQARYTSGMQNNYEDLGKKLNMIDRYDQSISNMTTKVEELQSIFHSPRMRGMVGEMQLEALIRDVWPPTSYSFQTSLSNGSIPDCILKLPMPIGNLVIDAKFPLDAFLELQHCNSSSAKEEEKAARKKLSKHLRNHVKTIADKYIIPGETANSAVLFLPSEAVFSEVVENHQDVITDAFQRKVWVTSPITLLALLTTMRGMVRDLTVSEHAEAIMGEVRALKADIARLVKRNEDVDKHFQNARDSLLEMQTSTLKIARRSQKMTMLSEEETVIPSTSKGDDSTLI